MVDIPYGTRVKNTQANSKATLRLAVPHFGEEDAVRPLDVKGKIAFEDFQLVHCHQLRLWLKHLLVKQYEKMVCT